jgi:hypothetical protein
LHSSPPELAGFSIWGGAIEVLLDLYKKHMSSTWEYLTRDGKVEILNLNRIFFIELSFTFRFVRNRSLPLFKISLRLSSNYFREIGMLAFPDAKLKYL